MLNRTIAKFLFYAVALVLLVWTSSLTYSFLSMALPGTFWLVPLLGLVVFDVGMIAWLFVFLSHAEGAIQRAAAIILCLFNFVGVGLMTISEILLDGQTMVEAPAMLGTVAIWAIGIWTTVNVLGVLVFHLGDNKARREMALQSEKDAIFDAALDDLKTRRIAAQKALSQEMSAVMMDELTASLRADNDRNGVPDIMERGQQSGPRITTTERPQLTAEQAAQVAAYLSLAQPVDTGNSTHHDTPRHDTHAAPPQAGQGQPNGPATKPLGRTGDGRP
jgi:hypothetical protein